MANQRFKKAGRLFILNNMHERNQASFELQDAYYEMLSEQYGTSFNVIRRWKLYEYASTPLDIHSLAINCLDLRGNETVLDIGCLDGRVLDGLRKRGHKGKLIGVDINPSVIELAELITSGVEFKQGDATNLDFDDNFADGMSALFMLYHVPEPERALSEFQRVLKPGGRLAVATSGASNKRMHRMFERALSVHFDRTAPTPFATAFDFEKAEETLPKWFNVIARFTQIDKMRITKGDALDDYLDALETMKFAFQPVRPYIAPNDWNQAVNEIVKPIINYEIDKFGYFTDSIERHFFICENTLW